MFLKRFNAYLSPDTGLELAGSEDTGAEGQEFAEPDVEESEGAEEEEFADPLDDDEDDERTDTDSAFAEIRRRAEAAERKAQQYEETLGLYFDGDGEDKVVQAKALYENRSPEEVRAEIEEQERLNAIAEENEQLKETLTALEVESAMARDLDTLQRLDPNIKSLDDLGDVFLDYISAGLPAEQAYFAMKAQEQQTKYVPPTAVGRVTPVGDTKDYFTPQDVDNMTEEEVMENLDLINASMTKWK